MVTRADKDAEIARLKDLSSEASIALVADFAKMTVSDLSALRRSLRGKGRCVIAKNTLAEIAFRDTEIAPIQTYLVGPSLIVFGEADPVETLKGFLAYQKTVDPKLTLKGGAMPGEGAAIDPDALKAISSLPAKEVLFAQIAGSLTATPSALVNTINRLIGDIGELAVKVAEKNNK
ncbi:MAG: 50S ribosomal protein L10 [Candidatus Caenarcaniphilales bacterium]|nr:50S ribosomal protein L10 [Candidatus Caenarcaniphilales bacterium]